MTTALRAPSHLPTCSPPSDDKQISKEECAAAGHSAEKVEEIFAKIDADKDGQLTKEELAEAIAKDTKDAAKTTAATAQVAALDTDGDKTKVGGETNVLLLSYSVTQCSLGFLLMPSTFRHRSATVTPSLRHRY